MDRVGTNFVSTFATVTNTKEITFTPAATAVTANGQSSVQDVSSYKEGILVIDITAVTGTTPTLNIAVQTYDFLSGKWVTVPGVTVAQQTAVGTVAVAVTNFGEQMRLSYTVGGTTPSFTLSAGFTAKS